MLTQEEKRNIWLKAFDENKEYVEKRTGRDIEKYRKGDCRVRLTDKDGNPIANKTVTVDQKTHDFKFGAHIFMLDEFENPEDNKKYRELFKEYFNLATVPFYWDGLEPEKGKPRYDKNSKKVYRRPAPELCLEYCEENGIDAKVHCLVYDKFIPDWLPKKDMAAMEKLYEERIRQIAERFKGRMYEFEVINETFSEAWWKTQSVICNKRDLVEWAFALARKYLPDETLVINDAPEPKDIAAHDFRDKYFLQIEKCLLAGAEIDKVGMQYHIMELSTASNDTYYDAILKKPLRVDPVETLKAFDVLAELKLPIEVTEVTFPTFGETEEDEELQAEILKNLYTIWFSHPAIDAVIYWNQIEGYCYDSGPESNWNENRCRGGLFHHDLTPKKSALMLKKLTKEVWHTKETLTTDENGYIEFRGFYGEYEFNIDGAVRTFGLHKNDSGVCEIKL